MGGELYGYETEQGAGLDPDLQRHRRLWDHLGGDQARRLDQVARSGPGAEQGKRGLLDRGRVKVSKGGVIETVKANLATSGGTNHESSTAAQVKTFKFLEDKVKTIQAASSRRSRHPTPRNDSVALEYICLDYVGGCTLSGGS